MAIDSPLGQMYGFGGLPTAGGMSGWQQQAMSYGDATFRPPLPSTSSSSPFMGFLNENFGTMGALGGMIGGAYLDSQLRGAGMMPIGNAGSYAQAVNSRQFYETQLGLAQAVGSRDREAWVTSMLGAVRLFNDDPAALDKARPDAEKAAQFMLENQGMLSMMPGFTQALDLMTGSRGSIVGMGRSTMNVNRNRIDPFTGLRGYGLAASKADLEGLFQAAYEESTLAESLGIRASQYGEAYSQLREAGLLPDQDIADIRRRNVIRAAVDNGYTDVSSNTSAERLQQILATDTNVQTTFGQITGQDINRKLEPYLNAISAMQEVFGENGRPGTMSEIINSLRALTSNQIQKFSPAELESMVRDVQAISAATGMTVDQVYMANKTAENLLMQAGVGSNSVHFQGLVAEEGILGGRAVKAQAWTGFGAINEEEARYSQMAKTARAVRSESARGLAAFSIMASANPSSLTPEGRALLDRARSGKLRSDDPKTKQDWLKFLERNPGINRADFLGFLDDTDLIDQTLAEDPNMLRSVRGQQFEEMLDTAGRTAVTTAFAGVGRDLSQEQRGTVVSSVIGALKGMGNDITDTSKRKEALTQAVLSTGLVQNESDAAMLGLRVFGDMSSSAAAGGKFVAWFQESGPEADRAREAERANVENEKKFREATASLGSSGRSLMSAIQSQMADGAEADIPAVLQEWLGQPDLVNEKNRDKLSEQLRPVAENMQRWLKLRASLSMAEDPEEKAKIQKEMNALADDTARLGKELAASQTVRDLNQGLDVQAERDKVKELRDMMERSKPADEGGKPDGSPGSEPPSKLALSGTLRIIDSNGVRDAELSEASGMYS